MCVRSDLYTDLYVCFFYFIRVTRRTGQRIGLWIRRFHNRLLGTKFCDHFSLYALIEFNALEDEAVTFNTNPNESLHSSLNEAIRQMYKKVCSIF
jgi:hypothetical protein